jgi:xylulokinase
MAYLIGIDIGTTGAKALLIDADGRVAASATESSTPCTPLAHSGPSKNPEDWWQAVRRRHSAAAAHHQRRSRHEIAGIGLTGQMHGMVLLGRPGRRCLRPCIMWNDQRTASPVRVDHETVGRERFLELT